MKYQVWIVLAILFVGGISWSFLHAEQPLPDRKPWETTMHVIDAESMRLLQEEGAQFSQTIPITITATWVPATNIIDLHIDAYAETAYRSTREVKIHLNQTTTGHERTVNGQLLPDSINDLRESLDPDVMLGNQLSRRDLSQKIAQNIRIAPHQAAEIFLADQHIDPATCARVLIELDYQEHTAILGGTSYIALWRIDADCQNRHTYGSVNAANGSIEDE